MNLGQNSVMTQFGAGDAEGPKTQKLPFFKPIDRELKVDSISGNQPFKSIKTGDIELFPRFDFENGPFLPYLPSKLR